MTKDPLADLPLGRNVEVIAHHPAGLIALQKPEGVLSHPNRKKDHSKSLLDAEYDSHLQAYLWTDQTTGKPREIHLRKNERENS